MEITWHVPKITSDRCVETIAKALLLVDDLFDVLVDPSAKTISFSTKREQAVKNAKQALKQAGYPPDETD